AHLVVAPWLVANAPELHAIRLGMAVFSPPSAHRGRRGSIRVLHQFARGPRIAEACVHGDVRIDAEKSAESQELVRTHVVRLQRVPNRIEDGGPLIDVAYTVPPLVRRNEVTTREAQ